MPRGVIELLGARLPSLGLIVAELALLLLSYWLLRWASALLLRRLAGQIRSEAPRQRIEMVRRLLNRGLGLLFGLGALGLLATDIYLLARGGDLLEIGRGWLAGLTRAFWLDLGLRLAQALPLLLVARWLTRWLSRRLAALRERAKAYEGITANDASIEVFFTRLDRLQLHGIWLVALIVASLLLRLPAGVGATLLLVARIYLIVSLGLLVVGAVAAVVDSLDALSRSLLGGERQLAWYGRLERLVPLLRRSLEYVVWVLVATLVLLQLDFIAQFAIFGPRVVQAITIFFLARVVIEVAALLIDRNMGDPGELDAAELQQRQTIVPIIKSLARYLILAVAAVLVLAVFGFNPAPILAGAGILGLVVGLGAQPLINDIMTGFFILFENMFLVGDYIETGNARGVVEAIDIRTTRLRDPDGQLHILRNGQIDEVVNYSKAYTFAVVEVGVAYESDLERVYRVLEETGRQLAEAREEVLEPTEVLGLKEFGESELVIRTVTRVRPGTHLAISFVLKRLIKEAFDREGIEIPYARRVLILQSAEADLPLPEATVPASDSAEG